MKYINLSIATLIEQDRREDLTLAYFGGYYEENAIEIEEDTEISDHFWLIDNDDIRYFINPSKVAFVDADDEAVLIAFEGFYFDDEEEEIKGALVFTAEEDPQAYRQAYRLYSRLIKGEMR
ncbi:hypothetical protein [Hydrogenobacter thermophilus]|uniref:hypothetical protein n=1 Tax=Hydrogenobacter thermophilus TaxID=940 RepID=UPI0030FB2CE3